MSNRRKLHTPVLVVALAACMATAWAASETLSNSSYIPSVVAAPVVTAPAAEASGQTIVTAGETVVALPDGGPIIAVREEPLAPAPVAIEQSRVQPPITIEEQRLSEDQRIQGDVIDLLARNPRLSGKIGVETADSVVTLSGYTITAGQAWRAGRDARGVIGVKHVVNGIRPRIGGSV